MLISIVANAVGLGNVWRFPYICYKSGGGAFFIPYVSMLVLAAMPIMGMEMALGQFTSRGPIESWNYYPLLGGVGISGIMITWLIIIYYSVLTAYALFYLGVSIYSLKDINNPVWQGCDHAWNTEMCKTTQELQAINGTLSKSAYATPTAEFWYNFVSEDEGDIRNFGYPNWKMVIALFLTWGVVLATICRGVRSMGKASYFFAIYPYFCIIFLVFAGIFKEGAAEGSGCEGIFNFASRVIIMIVIKVYVKRERAREAELGDKKSSHLVPPFNFVCIASSFISSPPRLFSGILVYLIPKWEKLLELEVWADAGQQIFFSLTLCQGVVQTLSSFNEHHQPCLTNTVVIVVVNCVTSFWVGFPIFAVLGHMAHKRGVSVDEVKTGLAIFVCLYK